MRTDPQMLDLILDTARADPRIRAAVLNGSRANPAAPPDFFQDFDVIYFVTDVDALKHEPGWIDRFGELMILQLPNDFTNSPPTASYCYLMQFTDGTRLDLTLYPLDQLAALPPDLQTIPLLDKDGLLPPFPPASDHDHLPKPPTAKLYFETCNEFWWLCPYVAKGLWRQEVTYYKAFQEEYLRPELMKMLGWYAGMRTGFTQSPGKEGKYLPRLLEPELWELLLRTYSGAGPEQTWDALFAMTDLFRRTAVAVGAHFGYAYPHAEDARVTAHLQHVRALPRDAEMMYP
jgi:aminoglycoside 6-adenylyltransferase